MSKTDWQGCSEHKLWREGCINCWCPSKTTTTNQEAVVFCVMRDFGNRKEYLAITEDREQADILAGQLDMEYGPDEPGCIVVYEMTEVWRLS